MARKTTSLKFASASGVVCELFVKVIFSCVATVIGATHLTKGCSPAVAVAILLKMALLEPSGIEVNMITL